VLRIRPSDATPEEFEAIRLLPEMFSCLDEMVDDLRAAVDARRGFRQNENETGMLRRGAAVLSKINEAE